MEEEKAAAYYDELTRKGGGAARFKQGLGFSSVSANDAAPSKGSALPSASSFLSSFVRASSPSRTSDLDKQAQLESIQSKLKKKPKENQHRDDSSSISRVSRDRDSDGYPSPRDRSHSPSRGKRRSRSRMRDRKSSRRTRSRSRSRDRNSRRRSRSRDRHSRRRSRSRSRNRDDYTSTRRSRSRDRRRSRRSRSSSESESSRRRKRSESPRHRKAEKSGKDEKKERNGVDYAKMIEGYDKMTPAERVKAKMKLQLSETVEKDPDKGMGTKWERFDFDKDAPLDDAEMEAAEDDATLVKHIGQSFRFSTVEARREEQIKVAHDEAMFGVPSFQPAPESDDEEREDSKKEGNDSAPIASLVSDQVLSIQQGSWRDRVRKT